MSELSPAEATGHFDSKSEQQIQYGSATDKTDSTSHSVRETQEESSRATAQAGVQKIEALATAWSNTALITAYLLIWVVYFVMLMQQAATAALVPYVTSAFQHHSLTPTVGVLSSVIGGVCNLTVAKILDIFGRPQGYAASLLIATIGLVMMAATYSVEMYAAAQVFWTVGNNALLYTVNIFVADTSTLRNRGLMTALTSSPNIITIWLGGPIAEAFLNGPGWRWCFGVLAVIVPILCLPLLVLLLVNSARVSNQDISAEKDSEKTFWQLLRYYAREFDAVGLLLITAGLALFLLPFNLYTLQPLGWKSPLIICLLVFGVVLLIAFALWERYYAPVTFIPFSLLLDRNMIGACVLSSVLFISFYCWNSLFSSFLQVVNGLNVTEASYVVQIYGLGSSLSAIAAGITIRYTGHFKTMTLYGAIPVYTLFQGLMIYFREPDMNVGYNIMCQIFISLAAGFIIISPAIAAMSASSHQHVAVVMAIVSMFSSVGGAIGSTVAGAIWQSEFPKKLAEYLPAEEQTNLPNIYSMLPIQLSYPIGSPARKAIQHAYSDAQSMMLAAGTAIWVVGIVAVAFWRNTNVKDIKQVHGRVV